MGGMGRAGGVGQLKDWKTWRAVSREESATCTCSCVERLLRSAIGNRRSQSATGPRRADAFFSLPSNPSLRKREPPLNPPEFAGPHHQHRPRHLFLLQLSSRRPLPLLFSWGEDGTTMYINYCFSMLLPRPCPSYLFFNFP